MDDTRVLTAADVESVDDAYGVLELTRYPEAAAATLKSEMEAMRLHRAAAVAATVRAFRRRCLQAAAAACALLLLLLHRTGRLPLRLRRLLDLLLFWRPRR